MNWEVLTMTSRVSCCSRTLLRKNLSRLWPLWALCLLALLIAYPMVLSLNATNSYAALEALGNITFSFGIFLAVSYAVVCAACLFHYLHNTCSAYMLHAFPFTRNTLFLTNVLSGLLFFLLPLSAAFLTALLILTPLGTQAVQMLLLCWLVLLLAYLFFFGLAVFCMFLTGRTASAVLIYCVLNFLATLLELLLRTLLEPALYGLVLPDGLLTVPAAPLGYLIGNCLTMYQTDVSPYSSDYIIHWSYILPLALVGLCLLAIAWLLYRQRHIEQVGEVITAPWARPIYQLVFFSIGALTLGLLLAALLSAGAFASSLLRLLLCLSFGGFVGFFLAEMRLKKSVKVFRAPALLRFLCAAVVLSLFVLAFYQDWFHMVRRIPDAQEVVQVELRRERYLNDCVTLDNNEQIADTLAMHQCFLEKYANRSGYTTSSYIENPVEITYLLRDGSRLTRRYSCSILLENAQYAAQGTALLDAPELVLAYLDAIQIWDSRMVSCYSIHDTQTSLAVELSGAECARFFAALRADAEAGAISIFLPDRDSAVCDFFIELPNNRYCSVFVSEAATHLCNLVEALEAEAIPEA